LTIRKFHDLKNNFCPANWKKSRNHRDSLLLTCFDYRIIVDVKFCFSGASIIICVCIRSQPPERSTYTFFHCEARAAENSWLTLKFSFFWILNYFKLGITRLLLWLKSTLLLKNRMQLYNYLYENTMFTNKWDAALFGKGKCSRSDRRRRKCCAN